MASPRQIHVGGVAIGGGAPVVVQSMTTTKTHDVDATLAQIERLVTAGCEIVRVAVPGLPDADALPTIVRDAARRRPELLEGDTLAEEIYIMLARYLAGSG